jgi:predicted nucleotidyltransferase
LGSEPVLHFHSLSIGSFQVEEGDGVGYNKLNPVPSLNELNRHAENARKSLEPMKMKEKVQLPETYQKDVRRAVKILKEAGCIQVFLFGSLTARKFRDGSDIDLAIQGCPEGRFFHLLGKLLLELDHSVDLVNLDRQDAFARYLEKEGELLQIG